MKTLAKICFIVASVFAALGIACVIVGAGLGVGPGQFVRIVHDKSNIKLWNYSWNFWDGWGSFPDTDKIDEVFEGDKDTQEGYFGGLNTKRLEMDLDRSSAVIHSYDGERIYVKAKNTKKYFRITEKGSDVLIEDHRGVHRKNALVMEIYLPKRKFEKISLDLGSGKIYAEEFQTENLKVEIGAGKAKIDTVNAEKVEAEIGAGELIVENMSAYDKASLEAGTGDLKVNNFAGGDLKLDCGIGNMDINVCGKESDYNYVLSCGIGSIDLNGSSYSGLGREKTINNNAAKEITMDCGIGRISLNLEKER